MHQINGVRDPATSFPLDIGRRVAAMLTSRIPEMQSFTWSARAA